MPRTPELILLSATLAACAAGAPNGGAGRPGSGPRGGRLEPIEAPTERCAPSAGVIFERSLGGVPEVTPEWVRDRPCGVRVVDVRERGEVSGPLGTIGFAEHVPLDRLAAEASRWDPDAPVVLVCRSGRRSARGSRLLEDMGLSSVASMTGGMLAWRDHGFAVAHPASPRPSAPPRTATVGTGPLSRQDIERHLGRPDRVRWVKVAALMLQGTRACVDGRDLHGVVGTPGGDAGELLLALAAAESLRERPIGVDEIGPLLDAFLDAFGRFYVHTDRHALEHLRGVLADDPRFAASLPLGDHDAVERLVRRPPRALERPLLDALTSADNVGCGHLRLILRHPDEYGVREDLTDALLRAIFRRLWRGDAIDFVVLEGAHEEGAVVNVLLDRPVRPYTRVPTLAPRARGQELFVNHPEVSAYLRRQTARFLLDRDLLVGDVDPLRGDVDEDALLDAIEALAAQQLDATLSHLAARLPVYDMHVDERTVRVERRPGPATGETR